MAGEGKRYYNQGEYNKASSENYKLEESKESYVTHFDRKRCDVELQIQGENL